MGFCKISSFTVIFFVFVAVTNGIEEKHIEEVRDVRAVPDDVVTTATNMPLGIQQKARLVFVEVYDQHPEEKRCEELARGFSQAIGGIYLPKTCACIKYLSNGNTTNFFIASNPKNPNKSLLYIEYYVPADNTQYFLMCF